MISLEAHELSKHYTSEPILEDLTFRVMQGEKVGLVGENGCGKSTLLRLIAGLEAPTGGVLTRPGDPTVGYLAQEHETLDPKLTVMEQMLEQRGLTRDRAFQLLSRFLFRWQELDQRVGTLSGGQKSRLQLAGLMAAQVNFLLLDEPTNHLDIYSCERIEEALEAFEGTVLVISHDRYFLERIVAVDNLALVDHPGSFSEYWQRRRAVTALPPVEKTPAPRIRPARPARTNKAPRPRGTTQEDLAARIEALEAEHTALEKALAEAYAAGDRQRGSEYGYRLRQLSAEIAAQYAAWEEALS